MIKFLDLKKINCPFESDFHQKMNLILEKGTYILGNEVKEFEEKFAKFSGYKYGIGVGNGLDALVLIFKGHIELGTIQKGDEVIVPANTYIASVLAILQAELIPVFVEPRLDTYNLNPELIQDKITSKTRAILAVHLYGQLAEMNAINDLAGKFNLLVIEDAAQSHGAIPKNNKAKNTQAYSFYPGKNLGALGDGGAILTQDQSLANIIFSLRNYGSKVKYYNDYIGVNSRLDEFQAGFLNVKLPKLNAENQQRRQIAKKYLTEIKNPRITLPFWDSSDNHVFHLFVIRTEKRNELQEYLYKNGIETLIHYPVPPHKQRALSAWNTQSFPITEKIHNEVLSLPISPVLTLDEVDYMIQKLNAWIF